MAGGIDWFRWHHGSVNDPKFQLVARRSKSSVAEVIAVWASLLEAASMSEKRGAAGAPDFEALDCALGLEDGKTARIVDAMHARDLLEGEACQITAWEKRQPKREREDDNAADRKRAQRARDAAADGVTTDVTPSHAMSRTDTPRGEKRREEEIASTGVDAACATPGDACKAMKAVGLAGVNPSHPKLSALLAAGITVAELTAAALEAVQRQKSFPYALATAEGRRRDAATEPLPAAATADPDSRSAVEAEGIAKGIGPWVELREQWPAYKARVRGAPAAKQLDLNALAGMAAQRAGATA